MRVGIQTWGSEGDLRPFFALAEGLAQAGHDVALSYASVDDQDHTARLSGAGFRHRKAGALGMSAAEREAIGKRVFSDPNPVRQLQSILAVFMEPIVPAMTDAAVALAQSSDVVLHHMIAHPACAAAEKHGKPTIALYTAPMIATRAFPVPGAPDLGFLNGLVWKFALGLIDKNLMPSVAKVRAQLGLPPVKKAADMLGRSILELFTVSPTLMPRPADWPEKTRVCGFLNPPAPASGFTLPEGLEPFLAAGPAPVFVTFGSMAMAENDPTGLYRLVTEAIDAAGCRAIVQLAAGDAPAHPRIFRLGAAPHDVLFPRCAAIVHHGGAGTTQAAMRAGRPSVLVAHITDQFLWGKVLSRHGVAPPHLTRKGLTPKKLAAAIGQALAAPAMAAKAAALGAQMQAEDGIATAVKLIEAACAAHPRS